MSDIVIKAENLGKKYMIGHQSKRQSYMALRDVLMNNARAMFQKTRDLFSGRPVVQGDTLEEVWALKDINFDIRQGEAVGIIGRNGAGKSTLLKILSRITEPTEGRVTIRGRVASLLEVGTGFHPELTGRENIYLNGAIMGMTRAEIKRKFDEIVAFAEVEKYLDTPVKRYSSGMYVRLAFAVAAHIKPEILIIDEVLAVGDIAFQKKCLGKMGDVAKEGRTIIFVSHNMGAIRSLCERVVWLDNGKIKEDGTASKVVRDYEDIQIRLFDELLNNSIIERKPDDVKNSSFYFSHVEMLNSKREHVNIFRYNEIMTLIVNLSGELLSQSYCIEFYIYTEFGQLVSVGSSGAYHGIYFNKNVRKIEVNIGPIVLTGGKYTIALSIVSSRDGEPVSRPDMWENACSFVFEAQPFRPGRDISSANEGICILQQSFARWNE